MSGSDTVEFAPAVLGSLDALVPSGRTDIDIACELGVSAWMRRTGTDLASVPGHLWAIRQAVLEVGPLDAATEPVPLGGRDPRAEVRSLVIYLSDLVDRAAARRRCSRGELIDLALGQPVLHGRRPPAVVGLWERRSS